MVADAGLDVICVAKLFSSAESLTRLFVETTRLVGTAAISHHIVL
jgi:hypothetical protein